MKRSHMFQFIGWMLFFACSVLYLISGMRSHDIASMAGSMIFFIGCVVFLVPLVEEILRTLFHDDH
ncbi:MAG: hypothetical protein K9M84_06370 [Spirochaetia bacterium]|nr:hypothetical protein [Spirochaetia bacterium]MCF7941216.1 hypothetical protein [Spirochaetia bacterium]